MADKLTLESWIGRDIMIARASATEAELVRLESLTKWGVVCTYSEAEVGESVLIPWGAVSWVRPAVEAESQTS